MHNLIPLQRASSSVRFLIFFFIIIVSSQIMKPSRQQQQRGGVCKALCCSCNSRLSVSSSSEDQAAESSSSSADRFPSVSSLAHTMVQERLDQMIRSDQRERSTRLHHHVHRNHHQLQKRSRGEEEEQQQVSGGTKFVVMMATEKSSCDPREDFRDSMVEMIMANRLQDAKELRSLLNYYVSMNSQDYHSLILEVFHEVCTNLFLSSKCPYW